MRPNLSRSEIDDAARRLRAISKDLSKSPVATGGRAGRLLRELRANLDALFAAQEGLGARAQRIADSQRALMDAVEGRRRIVGRMLPQPAAGGGGVRSSSSTAPPPPSQLAAEIADLERRRIARELHDTTGQTLTALAARLTVLKQSADKLDARARRALRDSLALARTCAREVRSAAYLLHPPLLAEGGLAVAIRNFVQGFSQRSEMRVDLSLPRRLRSLPESIELPLFRVVQESLRNAYLHSGSRMAAVRLEVTSRCVVLDVRDHGGGSKSPDGDAVLDVSGVGIAGMVERIAALGGALTADRDADGFHVRAVVPLASRGRR